MWHDALLVGGKDLRIEFASRVGLNQVGPFALGVLVLFGLAIGPSAHQLAPAAPGLLWVAVLFATVLAVQRSFAVELANDAVDGLRLAGLDPAGIFFGKAGALALQLSALEVVLALVAALLYGVALGGALVLVASALLATLGLSALGALYGVLSLGTRTRESLLPLLFLPVAAPVLIAATKSWQDAFANASGHASGWIEVLAVFAVIYLALGALCFGPLLEDR